MKESRKWVWLTPLFRLWPSSVFVLLSSMWQVNLEIWVWVPTKGRSLRTCFSQYFRHLGSFFFFCHSFLFCFFVFSFSSTRATSQDSKQQKPWAYIYSCICSFIQQIFSKHLPGLLPGSEDTNVNKTQKALGSCSSHLGWKIYNCVGCICFQMSNRHLRLDK